MHFLYKCQANTVTVYNNVHKKPRAGRPKYVDGRKKREEKIFSRSYIE